MQRDKILITTNLKDTWKDANEAFFSGEWCINYNDKIPYKKFHVEKDVFRNRLKLYDDYKYLSNLYQNLIVVFAESLNSYHKKNYTVKFWKIFFGIWLRNFLEISFAHYKHLNKIISNNKPSYSVIREFDSNHFFIENYKVYTQSIQSDSWRHYLQAEIIKNMSAKINLEKIYPHEDEEFTQYKEVKSNKKFYIELFKNTYLNLFKKKIQNSKFFIKKTYLGNKEENLLNFKLGAFPTFLNSNYKFEINQFNREDFKVNYNYKNEFEKIILNLIIKFIPSTYLENFRELNFILNKTPTPKDPKIIFSSHLINDELLALYSALKIEKNKTILLYGQHGGVYGQYKFSTQEDHEIELSDKYLSWGWNKHEKNIPFGILKRKINYKFSDQKKILFILRQNKIFFQRLNSGVWVSHYEYMEFIIDFLKKLNPIYLDNMIIRLHARRYSQFDEKKILNDQNLLFKIDDGSNPIQSLIKDSKLIINSYISSGFLELAANNIPNILFAQFYKDILDEKSVKIFDELKECNMYFDNADNLKKFLSENHSQVKDWWFSDKVQKCREKLCKNYAIVKNNKLEDISNIIKKL